MRTSYLSISLTDTEAHRLKDLCPSVFDKLRPDMPVTFGRDVQVQKIDKSVGVGVIELAGATVAGGEVATAKVILAMPWDQAKRMGMGTTWRLTMSGLVLPEEAS
ncbi:MAG: hypothetical protein QOK39_2676 [Acidimicrobiaceae bacterium]|nr:hypothetical protein [Acidimicrobiaceae bacterium]